MQSEITGLITPGLLKGSVFTIIFALITTYVGIRTDLTQTRDEVEAVNQKLTYIITTMEGERATDRDNLQRQIDELKRTANSLVAQIHK